MLCLVLSLLIALTLTRSQPEWLGTKKFHFSEVLPEGSMGSALQAQICEILTNSIFVLGSCGFTTQQNYFYFLRQTMASVQFQQARIEGKLHLKSKPAFAGV